MIDDQVAPRLEPHLPAQSPHHLLLNPQVIEQALVLVIEVNPRGLLRRKALHEVAHGVVLLPGIDPEALHLFSKQIADHAEAET
jgi:hypothetical protein